MTLQLYASSCMHYAQLALAMADREASFDRDSEIEFEDVEQLSPVVTLLEQLKSPTVSDLARKRKKNSKKSKGVVAAEPFKVSPSARIFKFN
jgi:hypothetical protein